MSATDPPQDHLSCPVDHHARTAWLEAAAAQAQEPSQHPPQASATSTSSSPLGGSCDSSSIEQSPSTHEQAQRRPFRAAFASSRSSAPRLSTEREVSTIPRAQTQPPTSAAVPQPEVSPNAQNTSPATSASGNWIYPSESQFHAALVRKHGAESAPPADAIPPIIPIHNAVNERTWREVLGWERCCARPATSSMSLGAGQSVGQGHERDAIPGQRAEAETRPKLVSFSGDSQKLTPRARWLGLLGYSRPFDRHDWVVERGGGERVEYVIDFYAGKAGLAGVGSDGAGAMPLSFYLDVRPKLNSWEGVRMRFTKCWGL